MIFLLLFPLQAFCADVTATETDVSLALGRQRRPRIHLKLYPSLATAGFQAIHHEGPVIEAAPGRLQAGGEASWRGDSKALVNSKDFLDQCLGLHIVSSLWFCSEIGN
jgi:hypothetical protein